MEGRAQGVKAGLEKADLQEGEQKALEGFELEQLGTLRGQLVHLELSTRGMQTLIRGRLASSLMGHKGDREAEKRQLEIKGQRGGEEREEK